VFPEEEVEEIDVNEEWQKIALIDQEIKQVTNKIDQYLKELSY